MLSTRRVLKLVCLDNYYYVLTLTILYVYPYFLNGVVFIWQRLCSIVSCLDVIINLISLWYCNHLVSNLIVVQTLYCLCIWWFGSVVRSLGESWFGLLLSKWMVNASLNIYVDDSYVPWYICG